MEVKGPQIPLEPVFRKTVKFSHNSNNKKNYIGFKSSKLAYGYGYFYSLTRHSWIQNKRALEAGELHKLDQ